MCEVLSEGKTLDISDFSEILADSQIGYLVSVINGDSARGNPLIVLKDCISVILTEKDRKKPSDIKNMDVEDWAENLKKMIDKKRGKRNG